MKIIICSPSRDGDMGFWGQHLQCCYCLFDTFKTFLMKWGKMFASYEISLKRYDEFKMTLEFTAPQYEMYQSSLCDNPEYVHPNQEVRLFTC